MRRVVRVAALVLALAVLSVAVAWTCAAIMPLDLDTTKYLGSEGLSSTGAQVEGFGRTRYDWMGDPLPVPAPMLDRDGSDELWAAHNDPIHRAHSVDDSGWPFRCMRATVHGDVLMPFTRNGRFMGIRWAGFPGSPREEVGVLLLTDERLTGVLSTYSTWRGLGLQPLWLGLLGNVCVYLGVVAIGVLLLRLARSLRVSRRAKRGECVRCAHPLAGGAVCPECGTPCAAGAAVPSQQRG